MRLYRKRPVTVEAVQWDGRNLGEIIEFTAGAAYGDGEGELWILTLEGTMHASEDDFIIKGVDGEFYPCKPGIFAATYEPLV